MSCPLGSHPPRSLVTPPVSLHSVALLFFLFFACVRGCVCVCVPGLACAEVDVGVLICIQLFSEMRFLTEPGAHCID